MAVHAGSSSHISLAHGSPGGAVQRGEDVLRAHVEALRVVQHPVVGLRYDGGAHGSVGLLAAYTGHDEAVREFGREAQGALERLFGER